MEKKSLWDDIDISRLRERKKSLWDEIDINKLKEQTMSSTNSSLTNYEPPVLPACFHTPSVYPITIFELNEFRRRVQGNLIPRHCNRPVLVI